MPETPTELVSTRITEATAAKVVDAAAADGVSNYVVLARLLEDGLAYRELARDPNRVASAGRLAPLDVSVFADRWTYIVEQMAALLSRQVDGDRELVVRACESAERTLREWRKRAKARPLPTSATLNTGA